MQIFCFTINLNNVITIFSLGFTSASATTMPVAIQWFTKHTCVHMGKSAFVLASENRKNQKKRKVCWQKSARPLS